MPASLAFQRVMPEPPAPIGSAWSLSHQVHHRTERLRGVNVPVTEWSGGGDELDPTVILLPGLLGQNRHWARTALGLRGVSRCVGLEIPYTELSTANCSIEGTTAMAAEYLDRHVAGPVVVVGNSVGGHVAARLAMLRPWRVKGLVLAGAGGLHERQPTGEVVTTPSRQWLRERFGCMFHRPDVHVTEEELDRALAMFADRSCTRAFIRMARSSRDDQLEDALPGLNCPTLLVWGENDIITPEESALAFHRGIRNSRLRWLESCGHAPMIERPERLASMIESFIESIHSPDEHEDHSA